MTFNSCRDIQPSNLFLDKNHNILLGDWGQSKTWTPFETTRENCGSLCYAAPVRFPFHIWKVGLLLGEGEGRGEGKRPHGVQVVTFSLCLVK